MLRLLLQLLTMVTAMRPACQRHPEASPHTQAAQGTHLMLCRRRKRDGGLGGERGVDGGERGLRGGEIRLVEREQQREAHTQEVCGQQVQLAWAPPPEDSSLVLWRDAGARKSGEREVAAGVVAAEQLQKPLNAPAPRAPDHRAVASARPSRDSVRDDDDHHESECEKGHGGMVTVGVGKGWCGFGSEGRDEPLASWASEELGEASEG
eukprot:2465926-Rhodomonas_salina.2